MLSPLEEERNELGYHVEEVRGKALRVIVRAHPSSERCVFLVHGGGGRAGQFKHQIRALEAEYVVHVCSVYIETSLSIMGASTMYVSPFEN